MNNTIISDEAAPVATTNHNQSLNKAITYQGSHQVQADISITDTAPVKRSYQVVNRRALKFAQFFAAIQESDWNYRRAVHYLRLAYGFASEPPEDLMPLGGG